MPLAIRPIVIVAAALIAACTTALAPAAPVVTPGGVRFAIASPEAGAVFVAGSFNQWSATSHPLRREGTQGMWTATVMLPPGEHLFMYIIDGVWVAPPAAEGYADDGFGGKNGVVVVRP
jgi:1,4-alpha-glucan branching enzyme